MIEGIIVCILALVVFIIIKCIFDKPIEYPKSNAQKLHEDIHKGGW